MQISEAQLVDKEGQTDHEVLPSGRFVLIRDIKKALNGEDFIYFPKGAGDLKAIKAIGIDTQTYISYFSLFNNYKNFGLPHGKGFLSELPWVIDFLAMMNNVYVVIENWHIEKGSSANNLDVNEVGL